MTAGARYCSEFCQLTRNTVRYFRTGVLYGNPQGEAKHGGIENRGPRGQAMTCRLAARPQQRVSGGGAFLPTPRSCARQRASRSGVDRHAARSPWSTPYIFSVRELQNASSPTQETKKTPRAN